MTTEQLVKSLRACGRGCCDDCICDKEGLPCRAKDLGAADLIEAIAVMMDDAPYHAKNEEELV